MELSLLMVLCWTTFAAIVNGQCIDGDLQLIMTASVNQAAVVPTAGRLEVCLNGQWGTIAADSFTTPWSEKNAQVACRQLGFSGALNSILQGTTILQDRAGNTVPVHYNRVGCDGTESRLVDCPLNRVTSSLSHNNDVFIVCRPTRNGAPVYYSNLHTPGPNAGDIRLLGSPDNGAGAVEIYTDNVGWTGICPDSSWTSEDARTICQALGYERGAAQTFDVSNGAIGQRQADNAHCTGSGLIESQLVLAGVCSLSLTGECSASETAFAGVLCSSSSTEASVRLFGNTDRDRPGGMVEVFYNGRWGLVCDRDFVAINAEVICQQLGHRRQEAGLVDANVYQNLLRQESSLKPIWLNGVQCLPTADSLSQCPRDTVVGFAACSANLVAAVECGGPRPLNGGEIAGIVIAVLVVVGAIIGIPVHLDKMKKEGKLKGCHTRLLGQLKGCCTSMGRSCSSCFSKFRPRCRCRRQPRHRVTQQTAAADTQPTSPPPTVGQLSFHQDEENATPNSELTKVAPPSYAEAGDLPPPYPGGPAPSLAYPPPAQYPTATIGFVIQD